MKRLLQTIKKWFTPTACVHCGGRVEWSGTSGYVVCGKCGEIS